MKGFFYPDSVAVVGVSARAENLGRRIIDNLHAFDYRGIVYPVGSGGGIYKGHRIYKSVSDIPDRVDLAVILVPARFVPAVVDECGQKGIRRCIIESAGFREFGEQGRAIERDLTDAARRHGIRFIGPNCIGVINWENGLSSPFTVLKTALRPGGISIITQSGGVGLSILHHLENENVGVGKFISAGNMLDVTTEDLLEYLIDDPGTSTIFLYLEGIQDGLKLMDLARRSAKPVICFKGNIGRLGRNIAASHTASLSSDDAVVDAAFRQSGIARVSDITSTVDLLKLQQLPPLKGNRLAIVSRSGGHAVLAADAAEVNGFELAPFKPEFISEIESHFRASVIKLTNPLDLGDLFDLDVYTTIVEETLKLDDVDGVFFLHTYFSGVEGAKSREMFEAIRRMSAAYGKPVVIYVVTEDEELAAVKKTIGYPFFTRIVETVRAMRLAMEHHHEVKLVRADVPCPRFEVDDGLARALLGRAAAEGRNPFLDEAFGVVAAYGIPVARSIKARDETELIAAARAIGFPVAIKVISSAILHKTDVGGVQLNLRTEEGLLDCHRAMMARIAAAGHGGAVEGVLVQPMSAGRTELILGGRRDGNFGPVVLLGMGGIFVEVYADAVQRVAPLSEREASTMIDELRSAPVLKGARGRRPADLDALKEAILRLAQLMCDFPKIAEIDINPVHIFPAGGGCLALDARIILGAGTRVNDAAR